MLTLRRGRALGSRISAAVSCACRTRVRCCSLVLAACVLHVFLATGCGGDDATETLAREPEQATHETASPAEDVARVESPAQTRPQDPLADLETTFQGHYSRAEITARIDQAMDAYDVPGTDDNYARSAAAVVALRKELGVPEMDILEYMTRSTPPGRPIDFSEAALQAAILLAAERRPLGAHG